jgi:sec-independent protein translocase protein TatC
MMSSKPAKQTLSHPKKPKRVHGSHKTPAKFAEHIAELRWRIAWVGLVFAIGSVFAYSYREPLMHAILAPLNGQKLVYLTPGGGFSFIFQVSMYSGLIAAAPLLLYHLHAFIKPALPARAQQSASKIVLAAVLLMFGGMCYGYFIAVPNALHFLMEFAGDAVTPNLTADSYLSFFLAYTGGLALLALLPLLLMFWHWISPLTPGRLLKSERWVVVLAFVAAAIVTPTPDVVNQTMIAGPVIGLYQLGVFVVLGAIGKAKKTSRTDQKRRQMLQTIEERRIRTLHSHKAYLANATATDLDFTPGFTLATIAPAPVKASLSTSARATAAPATAAGKSPARLSSKTPPAPSARTIQAVLQAGTPATAFSAPVSTAHQQRLRYAGLSPIARQVTPATRLHTATRTTRITVISSDSQPASLAHGLEQPQSPSQALSFDGSLAQ